MNVFSEASGRLSAVFFPSPRRRGCHQKVRNDLRDAVVGSFGPPIMSRLIHRISGSLSIKLLLIGELVLVVAVLTLLLPLRREMREQVIRDLQNEVRSIAVTAALQLDGETLRTIRTPADANTP